MPRAKVALTGQEVSYCLTLVDAATQWTEIVPLADTSAKTTALAIQHHWIARHGMPTSLHSDLGICFTNQLFPEICNITTVGSGRSVIDDIEFLMAILAYFFFSSLSSVKTKSLPHTPNDLFDQICRKGVPFGSLVQKFLTPTL